MERIDVDLGARSYPVFLADDFAGLGSAGSLDRTAVVVTDDRVAPLWLPEVRGRLEAAGARVRTVVIPAGEVHKTWATAGTVLDGILERGFDRRSLVVALGGGVVGDVAGFCASVALRGVQVLQVPTTLLAMVDASVGGKTAVDHPRGKNLIGTFHQPSGVYAARCALDTLPDEEWRSGLGEVLKTGLLAGDPLFSALRDLDRRTILPIVAHCVRFKAAVVAEDEREGGRRLTLNLGHTVAHALELLAGFDLRHGEAVAIGLVAEARLSVSLGIAPADLPDRIAAAARGLGLRTDLPPRSAAALADAMGLDKKAEGDIVLVPLLADVGDARVVRLTPARVAAGLEVPA